MNETLAQLIRLAYDNPDLRSLLRPIIISEIDPQLLLKTGASTKSQKRKKKKIKEREREKEQERERERERIQNATIEEMLSDFEFIAHIKRTQKDNTWVDPNTNLENNINSILSKARGQSDISGENISQEWASGIISELYKQHREEVSVDTAYGGDQYKAELDQLHEMLDGLANTGALDELRKDSRRVCTLISRKMSEGAFVERSGAISKMADNFLWGLERQAIPIADLLRKLNELKEKMKEKDRESLSTTGELQPLDDVVFEEVAKLLGKGTYAVVNLEYEAQIEKLQNDLGDLLGKQILKGIKEYGKEAISEGTMAVLEATVGAVGGGVVTAIANAFGFEHKMRKVKGNVVEVVGRGVDKMRGTKGSGEHWEEKFLQATMTPASINDAYQGRVDEISAKVKEAETREDILSLIGEVRNTTDQYYTEAKVDIDRSIQRSVVYKRIDSARNRGNQEIQNTPRGQRDTSVSRQLDRAIAGVSNLANLVSKAEAKTEDLRSKFASEPKHAGISLLLIQRELEQAYAEQEIISAFESETPKMFERSIDILKDRDKRDLIFGVKDKEIRDSFNKLTEAEV